MSSTNPSAPNRQPTPWTSIVPYIIPPFAAATAIVPVYYFFSAKSALQLGSKKAPPLCVKEALKGGCGVAPTIGITIGTQMIAQKVVERAFVHYSGGDKTQTPSFFQMCASCMIVSTITAPPLAAFNGQTAGKTIMQSLSSLSVKVTGAIVGRETSFLFSINASKYVCGMMAHIFGNNKGVEYASAFASGAIGSLIGHPADTAATLWQDGKKVINLRQLMNGGFMKAIGVGGFAMGYKAVTELITSLFQSKR